MGVAPSSLAGSHSEPYCSGVANGDPRRANRRRSRGPGVRPHRAPTPHVRRSGGRDRKSVTGRTIEYVKISPDVFAAGIDEMGLPEDIAWLLNYLFATVLDGRNAHLADGVRRALGREPGDFAEYARRTAAAGVWDIPS